MTLPRRLVERYCSLIAHSSGSCGKWRVAQPCPQGAAWQERCFTDQAKIRRGTCLKEDMPRQTLCLCGLCLLGSFNLCQSLSIFLSQLSIAQGLFVVPAGQFVTGATDCALDQIGVELVAAN